MDRRPLVIEPNGHRRVVLPSLARLMLSKEQLAARSRLLAGQFFLVNMRLGLGEIFRCGRCNGKHDRLTLHCIDRPFAGIDGGLYGYVTTLERARSLDILPPAHKARVEALRQLFGPERDLADSHPGLARQLAATRGAGQVDLDIGMLALGLLERIEPWEAQRQLDRINTRATLYGANPLVVPGLRTRGR